MPSGRCQEGYPPRAHSGHFFARRSDAPTSQSHTWCQNLSKCVKPWGLHDQSTSAVVSCECGLPLQNNHTPVRPQCSIIMFNHHVESSRWIIIITITIIIIIIIITIIIPLAWASPYWEPVPMKKCLQWRVPIGASNMITATQQNHLRPKVEKRGEQQEHNQGGPPNIKISKRLFSARYLSHMSLGDNDP